MASVLILSLTDDTKALQFDGHIIGMMLSSTSTDSVPLRNRGV